MDKRKAENLRVEQGGFYCYENVLLSFRYFQWYQGYVLDLCRSGFSFTLLEELNRFHESVAGTMASSSMERYQLYAYIGALLNTGMVCPRTPKPAWRIWRATSGARLLKC